MRHWEGPIILYSKPTLDLREIRPETDILTPLSIPVFAIGKPEPIGQVACFRASKLGISAYVTYDPSKIPDPWRGIDLFPHCIYDPDTWRFNFDQEKNVYVMEYGVLRAVKLNNVPPWQTDSGQPDIRPIVLKSTTRDIGHG